jgi:hypothetical protein
LKKIKEIISNLFIGLAGGCLILTLISIFAFSLGYEGYISDFMANYVKYSFVAMVIGVGFSLPSIVYEREDLSMPLKVLIHMGTGMTVYFLAVLYAGWIPASLGIGALIISLLIGISIAVVIWFGFYLYYREEALKINKQIKKMNQ